ncbi:MAG: hypothetical protein DMF23_09270, partial [Verrucomicrobia bacterium]
PKKSYWTTPRSRRSPKVHRSPGSRNAIARHAKRVRHAGETVISCGENRAKKFFAASEKVPILRVSASVA